MINPKCDCGKDKWIVNRWPGWAKPKNIVIILGLLGGLI